MSVIKDEPIIHPGWGVQFEDGTWLDNAYGWFPSKESFDGDIYDSQEKAQQALDSVKRTPEFERFYLSAKIVPAWPILCEKFRLKILTLEKINTINPSDISDIVMHLEDALSILKI